MSKKTETIGARLKKVRNEKGLSLEEVYSKTRIHTRVLEAIEENRAEEVLSRVYIKSFLKEYTRCLGLDWDELEKTFLTKAEPVPVKIPEKTIPLPEPVQSLPLSKTKIDFKKFIPPLMRIGLVVFIIYLIGFIGGKLISGVKSLFNRPRAAAVAVVKEAKPVRKPEALETESSFKIIPADESLSLEVATTQDAWIEVKADGKTVFRRILRRNSKETWEAKDSMRLWLGKAEAVELSLNGQALPSPGGGVVKNIVLTREGMKVGN